MVWSNANQPPSFSIMFVLFYANLFVAARHLATKMLEAWVTYVHVRRTKKDISMKARRVYDVNLVRYVYL